MPRGGPSCCCRGLMNAETGSRLLGYLSCSVLVDFCRVLLVKDPGLLSYAAHGALQAQVGSSRCCSYAPAPIASCGAAKACSAVCEQHGHCLAPGKVPEAGQRSGAPAPPPPQAGSGLHLPSSYNSIGVHLERPDSGGRARRLLLSTKVRLCCSLLRIGIRLCVWSELRMWTGATRGGAAGTGLTLSPLGRS